MPKPRFEHGGSDLWSNTLPVDYGGAPLPNIKGVTAILPKTRWTCGEINLYKKV